MRTVSVKGVTPVDLSAVLLDWPPCATLVLILLCGDAPFSGVHKETYWTSWLYDKRDVCYLLSWNFLVSRPIRNSQGRNVSRWTYSVNTNYSNPDDMASYWLFIGLKVHTSCLIGHPPDLVSTHLTVYRAVLSYCTCLWGLSCSLQGCLGSSLTRRCHFSGAHV